MQSSFDSGAFVKRVGERLVQQFSEARQATSPGTVGAAMETPVRNQLQRLLPSGIAVGSGFVIDSYGGTSRQTDVVLYERDICPVFSVNDTAETTYYPCEGVIAAGEVKSTLSSRDLDDSFQKIVSVKQLRRHYTSHPLPAPDTGKPIYIQRPYGSVDTSGMLSEKNTASRSKPEHQIFGFVFAGQSELSAETLCRRYCELTHEHTPVLSPNMLVTLDGQLLHWTNLTKRESRLVQEEGSTRRSLRTSETGPVRSEPTWRADQAAFLSYKKHEATFGELLRWIINVYRQGMTSDIVAFDRYFDATPEGGVTQRLFDRNQMRWLP